MLGDALEEALAERGAPELRGLGQDPTPALAERCGSGGVGACRALRVDEHEPHGGAVAGEPAEGRRVGLDPGDGRHRLPRLALHEERARERGRGDRALRRRVGEQLEGPASLALGVAAEVEAREDERERRAGSTLEPAIPVLREAGRRRADEDARLVERAAPREDARQGVPGHRDREAEALRLRGEQGPTQGTLGLVVGAQGGPGRAPGDTFDGGVARVARAIEGVDGTGGAIEEGLGRRLQQGLGGEGPLDAPGALGIALGEIGQEGLEDAEQRPDALGGAGALVLGDDEDGGGDPGCGGSCGRIEGGEEIGLRAPRGGVRGWRGGRTGFEAGGQQGGEVHGGGEHSRTWRETAPVSDLDAVYAAAGRRYEGWVRRRAGGAGPGRRWSRGSAGIAALCALLGALVPSPARAEGAADEADLHFQLGGAAYQRGDFTGALEHFFLSNRLVPNRNVVFNIARTFEQLKRFADAHHHYVDALAGETDPRAVHDVEEAIARVAPNVAVLEVTTSPPGATIYLDRKDLGSRGRSPRPLALPPGSYRVLAELEGHEPARSEVVVAELGKTTRATLTLTCIVGTVRISADGAGARGASVRVDDEHGQPACLAPCELALPPGPHQLYFGREGYQGATRSLTVAARTITPVTATLSPLTGSVVVSADERGALVTIDGRAVGFTPVVISGVPAGPRKVRITLRDHIPIEREIVVKPGEEATLADLRLDPLREVIAVSRFAEQLDDAPSSVSVVDGQELRAFGYPTIAESLRGVRGVYLSNDHVYASVGVRGIGQPNDYGNRVLVLSDGQSLNDNLLSSSYVGSDARVDLHDVERIEIVRGPGSLLYGTGAFSGVINLVTRPRDEPDQARLDVGTYENGVFHASAGFHYDLGRDRGAWASASVARSDGADLLVTLTAPPPGVAAAQVARGADKLSSGGAAGRAWWGPLTVQWLYHKREQSTPVGSYGTVLDDPRSSSTDTRMMLEARYEPQLSSSFQLMTRVHANRYFFDGVYVFDKAAHVEGFAGSWLGGEARLVYSPSPRLRVTGGGEAQVHPEATLVGKSFAAAGGVKQYLDVHAPYQFGAGYALVEGAPAPWVRLSGGARVDVYSSGPIMVPRAAIILHPGRGGTLKIMGGRAFRVPSIYEQQYYDGNETQSKARPLLPESVYSGEIEYAQRFLADWVALAAAHASYLEHLINTLPDPAHPGLSSYQNSAAPALAVGGDVELRREWRQGFMLTATYGYQYARFLDPKSGDARLAAAPEHLASARGVAPLVPELASLGLRATVEAPRRIDTQKTDVTAPALILDATLSGGVSRLGLRYTIGVYNLTGWRYRLPVTDTFLSRTLAQSGRTFLLDLAATYPPR